MAEPDDDPTLDALLSLDGMNYTLDDGEHVVKFVAKQVPASPARPRGLSYSLTLHDSDGKRLVGFDNAHRIAVRRGPSGRQRVEQDHRHRLETIRVYDYRTAADLIEDFWAEVGAVIKERGDR